MVLASPEHYQTSMAVLEQVSPKLLAFMTEAAACKQYEVTSVLLC